VLGEPRMTTTLIDQRQATHAIDLDDRVKVRRNCPTDHRFESHHVIN